MKITTVAKLSPIGRLLYWIKERESIRLKREAGLPAPWTDDEILQKYRFCNVRRMDDKVSKWLLENWYVPNKDYKNMVGAVALGRMFNLPSTLTLLTENVFGGKEIRWRVIRKAIHSQHEKAAVFNGAYIVSTSGHKANKIDWVLDKYVIPASKAIRPTGLMETTSSQVEACYGFSSFMAGQVTADLRWALSGCWRDAKEYAPLGPGSKRGLNRLYGFTTDSSQPRDEFAGMMEDTLETLYKDLPPSISERVEGIDLQNCLCEFDKYSRVLLGEGTPKQLYRGIK